jgi:sulfatase maturation enzyme AslB (radical SAM superfamily)
VAIATNGVERIDRRIERRIFVSIDGPREVHNRIRGAEIFDRVMNNIRGDKRVIIAPTLSTLNYCYVNDLVRIARDADVEGITFALYTSHSGEDDPLLLTGEKLESTIEAMKRAWRANKDIVFMTPYIIDLFRDKEHRHSCFFRGTNFVSYNANLEIKKPCVLGAGVVCRTCGCNVPVISHAMKKADFRAWFMLNRMFPQKYFRMNDDSAGAAINRP